MNPLDEWAAHWGVPPHVLADLRSRLAPLSPTPPVVPGKSETAVQAELRLRASSLGWRLWRNNVGALHDPERKTFVRYGLCNESIQVNKVCKSADLIGCRPHVVVASDVGRTIGQFVSIEVKKAGWTPSPTDEHEKAQMNWALLVNSLGGDARFLANAAQL